MGCSGFEKFILFWRTFVLAGLAVMSLWLFPPWQVEQVRGRLGIDNMDAVRLASLEDEYRRTLAQILGGLGLLYGLYLTHRRILATEDNVRVAQEGQVTERFTRAIEQLGHDEMAIRLGGIYALERLAKDSEKDHGPIMEVLTAYVREKVSKHGLHALEAAERPTPDIQAILTVIGRREATGRNRGNAPLDLSGTDLTGAVLNGAKLRGAYLNSAKLTVAYLGDADLTDAELVGAELSGATLTDANLTRTKLMGVDDLTAEQVQSAKNWRAAHLPDSLKYLLT